MSQFDFWQRWGAGLDDTQFANAWAALGVAGSRGASTPREVLEARMQSPPLTTTCIGYFRRNRARPISFGKPLHGSGPTHGPMRVGSRQIHLVLSGFPNDEPMEPWLRLLRKPVPRQPESL